MNSTKKTVVLALLTSMGVVLGIVENMIPVPVRVPGAKLGLSNVVQLSVLTSIGYSEGILIAVLKSLLIAVGTGNFSSLMYGLPAAVASTVTMILAYHFFRHKFSFIGISILGALAHNLVQVLMASLVVGNIKVMTYYPLLALISVFTGYTIGVTASYFEKYLNRMYVKDKF